MSLTKTDFQQIRTIVKDEVKPIKKDVKKINHKFDKLFSFIDKDLSKTKKRVSRIESHLQLPPLI